jgi:outer membrane immunogenic protein
MAKNLAALATIAAIAAFAAMPVLAADMAIKAPPPAPVVTPPLDWTGFYVGGNFGSGWATTSDSNTFFGATTGNYHIAGAIGGGQLGYNWQTSQWVLGVESDYDFSNVKGSTSAGLCAGVVCTIENTWVGTTRGRIGYSVGNWLPYATGGVAYGNVHIQDSAGAVHGGTNRTGWTAGAGIEYALTRNWSLKVEYLYIDLGSAGVPCTVAAGPCGMSTQTFNESVARSGIEYRF